MKLTTFISTVALATMLGWQVGAQTNVAPVILTNLIRAPDNLRDVNGQLYDINQGVLWETMDGDVLKVSTNGIVLSTFTMEPIYQATTVTERLHPDRDYLHASDARNDEVLVAKKVQVGDKKVPDKKILLLNYSANLYPAIGQTISFRAMRVGTFNYNGDMLELWDYGTEPTQDELRKLKDETDEREKAAEKESDEQRRVAAENVAAAKKATQDKIVKWNQEQADKGDAYGLLRMGERYRDGDGVPKDLSKARDYFTKSVNAGSPTATDALKKLNQAPTSQ